MELFPMKIPANIGIENNSKYARCLAQGWMAAAMETTIRHILM